ncbi:non-ribosomal peptide synthetase [Pseudovibrio sp. Tun.PSC04-5.I4]|uniref:non-ribosomal peptide synthetase n=1 Tax=Pseudovibrio sp. Tun.PSC04-5.I4 TaxID=1798213 RepID=UPI00088BB3D1|nr:non-ribosomal peptide synthetase [Pseudovibrio sp. Tun.PSC04-5.I4]SDQ31283.1 amino acid adenylation domain-containing protein [Pseudovibrio sp. Tun.PSC04-5.I4]
MQDGPNKRNLRNLTPEQLLKMRNRSTLTAVRRDGTPLPLSFAQERLWFLSRMDGIGAAYHLALGLRLHGHLETQHLQAALDQIIARHEGLRTSICEQDGQLVQCFEPATCGLPLRILQVAPGKDPEAEIIRLAEEESSRAFDLGHGPLARACLIRTTDTHHVLLLVLHHIISDGWSNGLLLKELGAHYSHLVETGHPAPLDAPALAYADYAVWQKQPEQHKNFEKQKAYWKDALAGAPERLLLPTDRRRPAQQSYEGDYLPLQLGEELSAKVRQLARRFGITPYLVLMASYAIVLSRLAGQEDLVIGTPSANRVRKELEEMVGLFVNTLALRFDLSDGLTVDQLLTRMREIFLDSQDNQSLPFEQVVEALRPQRTLSYTPLFQVMFAWQNVEADPTRFAGLDTEPAVLARTASQFDITLELVDNGTCIYGGLEYATSLFDKQTIERLAGYLRQVVRSICELPEQPVHSVPLMDDAARAAVLEISRAVPMPASPIRAIHQLFEECASRHGDRVAIVSGPAELTYDQLNQQANKLAKYLLERGVRTGSRVAVCLSEGLNTVVALLAVLKSGGAYVPLDPAHPPERLGYQLEDSSPLLVLCDDGSVPSLEPSQTRDTLVLLDRDHAAWQQYSGDNVSDELTRPVSREDLAYVIYTSGTTGRPKGVMVPHKGPANLVEWFRQQKQVTENDRVLLSTSITFDISVVEVFATLSCGACLVVSERSRLLEGTYLVETIRQHSVTVCQFVPSLLGFFLSCEGVETCTSVRSILCGGEAFPSHLAQRCFEVLGHVRLQNLYGPTEASIYCTKQDIDPSANYPAVLPIGQPIAGMKMYVLDRHMTLVPRGVAGDLYVAGPGVAMGYLNRPKLTPERFVPNPLVQGEQLYRTGDIGRYMNDGAIEYLGRDDFQIKVRGYRIEPGEIEHALCQCDGVTNAVVISWQDEAGEALLVTYVCTTNDASSLDTAALRSSLGRQLPDYMVPSLYVQLASLPLSANGKIDRKQLPEPSGINAPASQTHKGPQTPLEEALAQIWAEVLQLEHVGMQDNFFDIGGHSLRATRIIARMRDVLGIEVPLRVFFERPTIEQTLYYIFEELEAAEYS